MQVLVADDDSTFRQLVAGLLRKWDFEVVTATDGHEAWDILQRDDSPPLVLLDWMMPGLDGYEVCKRIRECKGQTAPYVIIVTGSREKEEIIRVVLAGADDYLIKPVDAVDLKIHLRNGMRMMRLQEDLEQARRGALSTSR